MFPSESCPRGTNFPRQFCPGDIIFKGTIKTVTTAS